MATEEVISKGKEGMKYVYYKYTGKQINKTISPEQVT
jgi:hypothetical protein